MEITARKMSRLITEHILYVIRRKKKKKKDVKEGRVITWYFRGREGGPDFRVGVIKRTSS